MAKKKKTDKPKKKKDLEARVEELEERVYKLERMLTPSTSMRLRDVGLGHKIEVGND